MFDCLLMTKGLDRAMSALETHRAVLALDAVRRILAINDCYLRLTGHRREALIDQPVWMLFDLGERCAGRMNDLLSLPVTDEAHLPELAHVSQSGRRFRVDARVFGIRDDQDKGCLTMLFARSEETGGLIDMRHAFGKRAVAAPETDFDRAEAGPRRRFDH